MINKQEDKIDEIKTLMEDILLSKDESRYIPIKNTTKQKCYNTLGLIQEILETNRMKRNRRKTRKELINLLKDIQYHRVIEIGYHDEEDTIIEIIQEVLDEEE